VYDVAARLRQKRGGAAIVLGALSPRTRNAQVALYQSGEVNYMVATDAIGMGLNLSIDHVAFAGRNKFDGQEERPLHVAELAQIAGRAGRYLNPGTFGTLSPLSEFSPRVIHSIETHQFPPETQLFWRNADLDVSTVESLLNSLQQSPRHRSLKLAAGATDQRAFSQLIHHPNVREKLNQRQSVELLWDICQIPDYRQLWFELHVKLLEQLFLQLVGPNSQIDPSFITERLKAVDDVRGDIETLLGRIADIRTWTYIAAHPRWLSTDSTLGERTMAIEDRLSDALHERLVLQFVERTRSVSLGVRARRSGSLEKTASPFVVLLDQYANKQKANSHERIANLIESVVNGSHDQFKVDPRGWISHGATKLAQLEAGSDLLHPSIRLTPDFDLGPGARSRLMRRLQAFGRDLAETIVAPLRVRAASQLTPAARGLVYQLEQNLGTLRVEQAIAQLQLLTMRDRQLLTSFSLHIGEHIAYVQRALTRDAIQQRAALVSARNNLQTKLIDIPWGAPSIVLCHATELPWLICVGYIQMGSIAIRADHFELLSKELAHVGTLRTVAFLRHLAHRLDCSPEQLEVALRSSGHPPRSQRQLARRFRRHKFTSSQGRSEAATGTNLDDHSRASRRSSE
jgi:ATP-dependent RNA helicase SUPV3L1/SUV3